MSARPPALPSVLSRGAPPPLLFSCSSLPRQINDGRHRPAYLPVHLRPKSFPIQDIWLEPGKTFSPPSPPESLALARLAATVTPHRRWPAQPMLPPCGPGAETTTPYGVMRSYNGAFAEGYFHAGVDFAAEEGEPVRSPAAGRVVVVGREAEGFEVGGNCVGVDHGQGVTSLFMHLSRIGVREGDEVAAGEAVGEVGTTGRSTGPHLHWGLAVRGKMVDPVPWMTPMAEWAATAGENSMPPWAF